MAAEKVPLHRVLTALDQKDRNFYDSLSDDEQKSLSPFLLVRYASAVTGASMLESYYVAATNHYVNRDFFSINKHPRLQWLCLTAVSPGMGTQRHQWVGMKKKGTGNKKDADKRAYLAKVYPHYKEDDISVLSALVTDEELKNYRKSTGDDT